MVWGVERWRIDGVKFEKWGGELEKCLFYKYHSASTKFQIRVGVVVGSFVIPNLQKCV